MAAIALHNGVGMDFCKALGIDPTSVRAIDLHWRCGEITSVTITRHIRGDDIDALKEVVERYQLEAKRAPEEQ